MCVYVLGWGLATLNETDSLIQIGVCGFIVSLICVAVFPVCPLIQRDYVSVCCCVCVSVHN